ncbi:MAG: response regulator [Hydrogenibacillus sp.]|nr:response regulator [Hydrogenibacillus sp.]
MASILVVDDQAGIRLLLKEIFERQGIPVILAADGREALNVVRDHPDEVGLILLDMKLPRMSGLDVLRTLRAEGFKTPVLIMTAYGEIDQIYEARRLGVDTYLSKPFDVSELTAEVAKRLNSAG